MDGIRAFALNKGLREYSLYLRTLLLHFMSLDYIIRNYIVRSELLKGRLIHCTLSVTLCNIDCKGEIAVLAETPL